MTTIEPTLETHELDAKASLSNPIGENNFPNVEHQTNYTSTTDTPTLPTTFTAPQKGFSFSDNPVRQPISQTHLDEPAVKETTEVYQNYQEYQIENNNAPLQATNRSLNDVNARLDMLLRNADEALQRSHHINAGTTGSSQVPTSSQIYETNIKAGEQDVSLDVLKQSGGSYTRQSQIENTYTNDQTLPKKSYIIGEYDGTTQFGSESKTMPRSYGLSPIKENENSSMISSGDGKDFSALKYGIGSFDEKRDILKNVGHQNLADQILNPNMQFTYSATHGEFTPSFSATNNLQVRDFKTPQEQTKQSEFVYSTYEPGKYSDITSKYPETGTYTQSSYAYDNNTVSNTNDPSQKAMQHIDDLMQKHIFNTRPMTKSTVIPSKTHFTSPGKEGSAASSRKNTSESYVFPANENPDSYRKYSGVGFQSDGFMYSAEKPVKAHHTRGSSMKNTPTGSLNDLGLGYNARYQSKDYAANPYLSSNKPYEAYGENYSLKYSTTKPTDYGTNDYGVTDYGNKYTTTKPIDYGTTDYGKTDYGVTDYGNKYSTTKPTDYGTTDYGTTDYANKYSVSNPYEYGGDSLTNKYSSYKKPNDYGYGDSLSNKYSVTKPYEPYGDSLSGKYSNNANYNPSYDKWSNKDSHGDTIGYENENYYGYKGPDQPRSRTDIQQNGYEPYAPRDTAEPSDFDFNRNYTSQNENDSMPHQDNLNSSDKKMKKLTLKARSGDEKDYERIPSAKKNNLPEHLFSETDISGQFDFYGNGAPHGQEYASRGRVDSRSSQIQGYNEPDRKESHFSNNYERREENGYEHPVENPARSGYEENFQKSNRKVSGRDNAHYEDDVVGELEDDVPSAELKQSQAKNPQQQWFFAHRVQSAVFASNEPSFDFDSEAFRHKDEGRDLIKEAEAFFKTKEPVEEVKKSSRPVQMKESSRSLPQTSQIWVIEDTALSQSINKPKEAAILSESVRRAQRKPILTHCFNKFGRVEFDMPADL